MANRERVIELRLKGLSQSDIARQLKISRQRVHQIITGYKSFASNQFSYAYLPKLSISVLNGCTKCGKRMVFIHHKDGNSKNNSEENLLPLCSSCHTNAHFRS